MDAATSMSAKDANRGFARRIGERTIAGPPLRRR
jgi:hypothetical protein